MLAVRLKPSMPGNMREVHGVVETTAEERILLADESVKWKKVTHSFSKNFWEGYVKKVQTRKEVSYFCTTFWESFTSELEYI